MKYAHVFDTNLISLQRIMESSRHSRTARAASTTGSTQSVFTRPSASTQSPSLRRRSSDHPRRHPEAQPHHPATQRHRRPHPHTERGHRSCRGAITCVKPQRCPAAYAIMGVRYLRMTVVLVDQKTGVSANNAANTHRASDGPR